MAHDCRVLVVEDEYLLAHELARELAGAGALVLGPIGTLAAATAMIGAEQAIDGAVLDVNLGGDMVFPVADLLVKRGVAFVFTTGYDASAFPSRFAHIRHCEKPLDMKIVIKALGREIDSSACG